MLSYAAGGMFGLYLIGHAPPVQGTFYEPVKDSISSIYKDIRNAFPEGDLEIKLETSPANKPDNDEIDIALQLRQSDSD